MKLKLRSSLAFTALIGACSDSVIFPNSNNPSQLHHDEKNPSSEISAASPSSEQQSMTFRLDPDASLGDTNPLKILFPNSDPNPLLANNLTGTFNFDLLLEPLEQNDKDRLQMARVVAATLIYKDSNKKTVLKEVYVSDSDLVLKRDNTDPKNPVDIMDGYLIPKSLKNSGSSEPTRLEIHASRPLPKQIVEALARKTVPDYGIYAKTPWIDGTLSLVTGGQNIKLGTVEGFTRSLTVDEN